MATAIGDYQWQIDNAPIRSGHGDLVFDIQVQVCTAITPTILWQTVGQDHYSYLLSAVDFNALIATGTTAQKIAAVKDRITNDIKAKGLVEADKAYRALNALLPGGAWPVNGVSSPIV